MLIDSQKTTTACKTEQAQFVAEFCVQEFCFLFDF